MAQPPQPTHPLGLGLPVDPELLRAPLASLAILRSPSLRCREQGLGCSGLWGVGCCQGRC